MICFKCGKQGHKEEGCPTYPNNHEQSTEQRNEHNVRSDNDELPKKPEEQATYGSWMMVKKPARRRNARSRNYTDV